jgi:hypothetical protein
MVGGKERMRAGAIRTKMEGINEMFRRTGKARLRMGQNFDTIKTYVLPTMDYLLMNGVARASCSKNVTAR